MSGVRRRRSRIWSYAVTACVLSWVGSRVATADQDFSGTRALGMGDALRAAGTGNAGLHLNPSGLTLVHGYVAEGNYAYRQSDGLNVVGVAISDSITSRVGAGLYFDYLNGDARDPIRGTKVGDLSGYELGLGIALPVGDALAIGFTPKYQSIDQPAIAGGKADGFTIDVGATVHLAQVLSLGIVGANLVEQASSRAPRELGFGVALNAIGALLLDFDAVIDFDTARMVGRRDDAEARYHLGGELLLAQKFALRAGYIRDNARDKDFIAYGASLVTSQLGLDFGGRTQVDGATMVSFSLRLFLQ